MNAVARAVRQLRWSIGLRGVRGTLALAARRAAGVDPTAKAVAYPVHPFDRENGVDTSGRINGSQLGAGHAHDVFNVAYLGTPPSRLENAVAQWRAVAGARPKGEYAFFDVGCGKGRVVMLASAMGFREVGGVELDPDLARVGQRNLERWMRAGGARCPVAIAAGDAAEVPLPELPCVIFLYNPFRGPVMRKLLARLERHAGDRVGELDVIYLIPNEAAEFAGFPRFQQLWDGMVVMSEDDRRWDDGDMEDEAQIWRR